MMRDDKCCLECYDVGNYHYEIWADKSVHVYYLIWLRPGLVPAVQKYATAASARRAMYKLAWDFSSRKALPRRECNAVL